MLQATEWWVNQDRKRYLNLGVAGIACFPLSVIHIHYLLGGHGCAWSHAKLETWYSSKISWIALLL
jgi:hypothetical protein